MSPTQITEQHILEIVEECLKLPDETDWVEFKENNFEYEQLWERLSWLSNAANLNWKDFGFLIYWIRDGSLEVVGTEFTPEKEKAHNAPLEFRISKDIQPEDIIISIRTIQYQWKKLVIFIVPAAIHKPTTFKEKSFIRIGSSTTDLSDYPEREKKIWNNVYNKSFEKQIAISGLQKEEVFDLLDVDEYFKLIGSQKPDSLEEKLWVLVTEKIIKKTLSRYEITNLWAILLAQNFDSFETLKRKWVRVVLYNGNDRSADTKILDGKRGYALAFEKLLQYIQTILPSYEKIIEGKRVLTNIYSSIAIREFVANALIHQDFSIKGTSVIIEIFSDRIEIANPGIPLVKLDRIIDCPPRSRNEDLASLMRRMKFCEELWTWMDKSIIDIEKKKLPSPDWFEVNGTMKVILYSSGNLWQLTKEDRIRASFQHCIIQYIERNYMTNSSFRERLGLPESQSSSVSRIIKDAQEKWFIKPFDPENKAPKHKKYVPYWV